MTTEPKRYTAKEAMHWMLDHQMSVMIHEDEVLAHRYYRFARGRFQLSMRGECWSDLEKPVYPAGYFYIRTEYNDWQSAIAAEKAQEDDKLPRVGESFYDFVSRVSPNRSLVKELMDAHQRYLDANFVRREGR